MTSALTAEDAALISCTEDRSQIPTGDAFIMICNMLLEADMIDSIKCNQFATQEARSAALADVSRLRESYPQVSVCTCWFSDCMRESERTLVRVCVASDRANGIGVTVDYCVGCWQPYRATSCNHVAVVEYTGATQARALQNPSYANAAPV